MKITVVAKYKKTRKNYKVYQKYDIARINLAQAMWIYIQLYLFHYKTPCTKDCAKKEIDFIS